MHSNPQQLIEFLLLFFSAPLSTGWSPTSLWCDKWSVSVTRFAFLLFLVALLLSRLNSDSHCVWVCVSVCSLCCSVSSLAWCWTPAGWHQVRPASSALCAVLEQLLAKSKHESPVLLSHDSVTNVSAVWVNLTLLLTWDPIKPFQS